MTDIVQPTLLCANCGTRYAVPFSFRRGAAINFRNNATNCPRCGHVQTSSFVSNEKGIFSTTAGLVTFIREAPDPRFAAEQLLRDLERAKQSGDLAALRNKPEYKELQKWLPVSLDAIANYVTIIAFILALLSKPEPKIEINLNNPQFIQQYNEFFQQHPEYRAGDVQLSPGEPTRAVRKAQSAAPSEGAVGRNKPCPCGSGKKFKKCHGAHRPVRR